MSERVISDPTVAGWELDPATGYWMWAAGSGGGGGSIQDGDTEGQITTWDGTEWTPANDVNVSSGVFKMFDRGSGQGEMRLYHEDDNTDFVVRGSPGSVGTLSISASDGGTASNRMTINADGNVGIGTDSPTGIIEVTGSFDANNSARFINSSESGYGLLAKGGGESTNKYVADFRDKDNTSRLLIDGDGNVNITGKLFINGEEVGAGGGAVDAYTKSESDGRYVPKSGNTTISGTLTATDFVTS